MESQNIICEGTIGETVESKEEKQKEEKTNEGKPKKEKTKDKKESSKSSKSKSQKGEEKDIYFIISYTLDKKEDPKELCFSNDCETTPQTILTKEVKTNNNKYAYKKVFKYRNVGGKKNVELVYYYGEELDKYIITLEVKDKTFIYDVEFKIGHRYLSKIVPIVIKQDIKYQDKLDLFLEAFENIKEESKNQELYKETIDLYSKKSSFSFLISLFSKIYQDKKFCEPLIEKFYKMNAELKEKGKKDSSTNNDRDNNLGDQFNSIMSKIESESESLIKSNGYNPIYFYGIIISYFNFYDYNTFENIFNKLNKKKEDQNNLYQILLIYYSQFLNPIIKDESNKDFFIKFFQYIISEKDFSYFTIGLKYISDLDTFIAVINETKEIIYDKYIKVDNDKINFKAIPLENNLELKKEKIDEITKGIKSIYVYSEQIKKLLVYFTSNFWKGLLKKFENPEPKCFKVCLKLREIFGEYNKVTESICNKEIDKDILKDIGVFHKNDEFAYLLNGKLKIYFKNNKGKLKNFEILGYIEQYNPYYKDENYKYKREAYILDDLDFEYDIYNTDEKYKKEYFQFIETFKALEYEDIFKDNMVKFIDLMINKIKDLSSFDTVMNLIRVEKIQDKIIEYIEKLKNKYEIIIERKIEEISADQLKEPVEIIAKFEKLIFDRENNINFLKEHIDKLKINFIIYNQLIIICNDDKYKSMKDFIFKKFLTNIEKIDSIITLIDSLKEKDKNSFLSQIMDKCKFTKEEYYSIEENNRINLLCALYEKKKLTRVKGDIATILGQITNDIDKLEIEKKKLDEFFKNKEEIVIKRLELIKLVMDIFEPKNSYDNLKKILNDINNDIIVLSKIKKSLSIFQKETFHDQIIKMTEFINKLENIKIKEYNDNKFFDPIKKLKTKFEKTAKEVDLVQNFLLFKVIYENEKGKNQDVRFKNAKEKMNKIKESFNKNKNIDELYQDNKKIFDIIKMKLINNDQRAKQFFETFKIFLFGENQKNDENEKLMKDLILLFSSKKYELDLKSIFYFFHCLNKEDEWSEKLAKKYKNFSEKNIKELNDNLIALQKEGIYEYEDNEKKNKEKKNDEKINNYSKLFTSLYEKKEAIDFLQKKVNKDISELYDRIDPNSQTLTIQKIDDTKKCIEVFNEFQSKKNNEEIFKYIKTLSNEQINAFESYSKVFLSIIELDRNDNSAFNIFDQVDKIIKNAKFLFLHDSEIFSYGKENKIAMDELVHLKNKINISPKNEKNKEEEINKEENNICDSNSKSKKLEEKKITEKEEKKENEKNDLLKEKSNKLLFCKNLITNMEVIYDNMQILRNKGNNLPIDIKIIVNYDKKKEAFYYLNQEESSFEEIETFLINAKDDYIKKLDSAYKEKKHTSFLYGKLFRKLIGYLDGGSLEKIIDIFRYILNKNNDEEIKTSKPANPQISDYVHHYNDYNKISFDNIYKSLVDLFDNNETSLKEQYERMSMIEKKKYHGIYLHECEKDSIGKFIYELFLQKIGQKPIAQNIMISSKETSIEEIQAFLNRAVLCDYNTLFIVEVNESLTDYQQGIMNNYLDELLTYRLGQKNGEKGVKIEKEKTRDYLDACIVFVFEDKNKELSLINEIGKYDKQDIQLDSDKIEESQIQYKQEIDNSNIIVISSDKCGTGKSFKIKKMIEKDNQNYFHFPLGGILTKKIISEKLSELLNKIKEEKKNNRKSKETEGQTKIKNAVHLDLTESEDTSLINEFLFSFLITKFYSDKETIIYIPKDIKIYIEIPNCFKDYLQQFGILRIFPREHMILDKKPELDLSKEMIKIFNRMEKLNDNKEIEEKFLKKYMKKNKNYSYYQIIIFIKLFISQYSQFDSKLKFLVTNDKNEIIQDNTEECIRDFAKSTTYFLDGGFQNLIMGEIDEEKLKKENKDYIDLLSDTYENDLKGKKFTIPLIFINKEKKIYEKLKIEEITSKENNNSKDYLLCMKKMLYIDNEVETDNNGLKSLLSILNYQSDNYVITNDNFTKMILLVYRIIADIPVIIMGETGCGKTALITKLNQILNNGEIILEIINIHPGITDKYLCKIMEEMNKKAEKQKKTLWVFFDEINTCLSLSLITEIFTNKTFNTKKIHKNIRLIGACNPYRRRKQEIERCGYGRDNENDKELVYLVQPLPQSLLNFVFSFGALNSEDEKKYIFSIIEKLFEPGEEKLHEATKEVIFNCHKYLREIFDPSVVSLREINRFVKIVAFFKKYFYIKRKCEEKEENKNTGDDKSKTDEKNFKTDNIEKFDKIISIICSVYLCYYIRLINETKREEFNNQLRQSLITLVNSVKIPENPDKKLDDEQNNKSEENIASKIDNKYLQSFIQDHGIKHFSDFLRLEEKYLLDKIELKKGIGKNDLLKENIFLMFVAVSTQIPLIIVGKPGTGKSLSSQLIYNAMRGEYSKDKFFREYPQIILTYFQGAKDTKPEDIEKLFEIAENKLKFYKDKEEYKDKLPISMILFDELGLAEQSESNPLKVLHSKLEYSGNKEGVSFIGISNYSLDAAKVNRAMNLSVPNLEDRIDQLNSTTISIVESISEELKDNKIFNILSRSYYDYKEELKFIKKLIVLKQYNEKVGGIDLKTSFEEIQKKEEYKKLLRNEKKIKEDFHSNRDLYNYIRGIASRVDKLDSFDENDVKRIINNCIERNFGGIEYEIDIDLSIKLSDIRREIENISAILKEKKKKPIGAKKEKKEKNNENKKKDKIKVSSVFFFKKIYNMVCDEENEKSFKLEDKEVDEYDLNKCIINNITDLDSRYLLLEIKSSLATLIYQNIKIQNPDKDIVPIEGSPFEDDNNNEYKFVKLREIQSNANKDKLVIMQNLDQIQPFLYDLYNMNYIIKDEEKCVRICFDSFSESLTPVKDSFRIIILADKKSIKNNYDIAFLNRLEKMKITFEKLLDDNQKALAKKIINDIDFKKHIENHRINYMLKDLLINCGKEEIQGLIYYETKKNNNKLEENRIREIIFNKIVKISSQDIISILPEGNDIKDLYLEKKQYYNLKSYIKDLNDLNKKISIIYTFDSIAGAVEGVRKDMKFLISNIKMENKLDSTIKEIKYQNESLRSDERKNNIIFISFEQFNSNKIKFVSEYIKKNYENDNYKYIFIIHIQRNFNPNINSVIYSIPDIDPKIEQLFIDNLNGPNNITLRDLLKKPIKTIMSENSAYMNLSNEFNTLLASFVYNELNEKRNIRNETNMSILKDMSNALIGDISIKQKDSRYYNEIMEYIKNNPYLKEKIILKAQSFLSQDKSMEGTSQRLVDRILQKNYIGKKTLDIISCVLNYIKEEIFGKYIKYIFSSLEDNNILTTLIEIQNNKNNEINSSIIRELIESLLEALTWDEKKEFNPKFLYNYRIPGFYNTYNNILYYIKKNIALNYFNLEKNLRKYESKANVEKKKNEFYKKEKELLSSLYEYLSNEEKFVFDNLEKRNIEADLMLKDFITFFLDEYNLKNEENNDMIELLLNLRYSPEKNNIIKENKAEPIKIMLIKMIWIVTNTNYILNILDIYSHSEKLYDKKKFLEEVRKKISGEDKCISYIVNETRNPEYTREVNECYYILLASFCLCLTDEEIDLCEDLVLENNNSKIGIDQYLEMLKKIYLNLQDLNDNLNISLNEMYIIDELIAIIELQKLKTIDIEKIKEIKRMLIENSFIIQKDTSDKYGELVVNFENIYQKLNEEKLKEIKTEEDKIYDKKYYDTLKYIYYKEIKKIIDQNYRNKIFEKIISDKEIIKRSGDILEILLKNTIKTTTGEKEGFKANLANLKKGNVFVNLIENNLKDNKEDNYLSLQEIILSFFEKSSLIYLDNVLADKKFNYIDEGMPLDIFEECTKFLYKYNYTDKLDNEIRHIRKLFCIGYIKVYCYKFFKMINENNRKLKDQLSIENLLKNKLSEKEKKMSEIIRLYAYKTIYNQNGKELDVFFNKIKKKSYKLDHYERFKKLFKSEEEEENINHGFQSLNSNFDEFYNKVEKFKKKKFDEKIKKSEIIEEDKEDDFMDNFINTSIILILSKLKKEEYELSEEYENYYNNICKPLFEGEEQKISILIEFIFNPKKYEEIKKYGFDYTNIESLLFGLRYSLNCLNEQDDEDKIYASLYDKSKISYLTEKCYPGSNPIYKPIYELFGKINNHFKEKPNEGCYICLCEKGFYHSVPSGFPGDYEKNMKCPNCGGPIGAKYIEEETGKKLIIIKREGYVRIFKDQDEIDKAKDDSGKNKKLQEINYMTINEFKEKHINKLYKDDKGLHKIQENYFKRDDKLIRNLSQVSYRLLNYILYSHLFFAKLYTGVPENFDKYLPEKKCKEDDSKTRMNWGETINECWILLKKELSKQNINYPEIFMNFTFKELYYKLNEQECINDYESLIEFENKLEELIQKKIEQSLAECKKYEELINKNCKDKDSCVSLLTEKFDSSNYDKDIYPNYENYYYSDYLDEENISKSLEHMDKEEFLMLNKYLDYAKNKKANEIKKKKDDNKDYYSLNNLKIFISVLNLFNERYSHLIPREFAENKKIEDDELYRQNTNEIEEFIKFFNELQKSESKKNKDINHKKENENKDDKKKEKKNYLQLSSKENNLSDLFIDLENKYGIAYKKILEEFIKRQNYEISDLLDKKIIDGKIDVNSTNKINIQQIKEDEIFTFNIPDKFSFISETFNSSYRKIIDNKNYKAYNEYVIDFYSIEGRLTDLLLKNKKLLNDDIIEFSYNNELFTNEISNVITTFKDNYNQEKLTNDDKEIIYKFFDTNRNNIDLYKKIIGNFMTLIKYLSINNEKNVAISEINEKIASTLSKEFLGIFKNEDDNKENKNNNLELTVNKTMAIFEYFLNFIFKEIKKDLEDYSLEFKDKKLEKKTKEGLENYFENAENNEEDDNNLENRRIIKTNNLILALKWFMTLVLFDEKDKENKIKGNKKNLIDYLNVADLWDKGTFKDNKFNSDLGKLKKINIQVNKIIWLYDFLTEGEEEEEDPEKEIKDYINEKNGVPPPKKKQEDKDKDSDESEPENNEEEDDKSEEDSNNEDDEGD